MVEVEVETNGQADAVPRALPKFVRVEGSPRFTANQLRVIRAATGQPLEAIMGDAAAVIQAFVWLQLRRDGFADLSWEAAGDIEIEFGDDTPDPTSGVIVTDSPLSVGSGE